MSKYEVGGKVRIRTDLVEGECYDGLYALSGMAARAGELLTVQQVDDTDNTVFAARFWWSEKMLDTGKHISIDVRHRKTVATLVEGGKIVKTAVARCSPDDTFDFATGAKLALDRLFYELSRPKYKVGDRVRIVDKWCEGCHQNPDGVMDKWLDKIMTIESVCKSEKGETFYQMVEDKGDLFPSQRWCWYEPAIAGLAPAFTKDDLRTGMFGKMTDGNWFVIVDDNIIYQNGRVDSIKGMNDDLSFTSLLHTTYAVEVLVKADCFLLAKRKVRDERDIIWQRK